MHYCGIDIVKYKHEATVIDEGGKALLDSLFFSNKPRTTAGIDSSHRHRHRIAQALQYDLHDSGKSAISGLPWQELGGPIAPYSAKWQVIRWAKNHPPLNLSRSLLLT